MFLVLHTQFILEDGNFVIPEFDSSLGLKVFCVGLTHLNVSDGGPSPPNRFFAKIGFFEDAL